MFFTSVSFLLFSGIGAGDRCCLPGFDGEEGCHKSPDCSNQSRWMFLFYVVEDIDGVDARVLLCSNPAKCGRKDCVLCVLHLLRLRPRPYQQSNVVPRW